MYNDNQKHPKLSTRTYGFSPVCWYRAPIEIKLVRIRLTSKLFWTKAKKEAYLIFFVLQITTIISFNQCNSKKLVKKKFMFGKFSKFHNIEFCCRFDVGKVQCFEWSFAKVILCLKLQTQCNVLTNLCTLHK